MPQEQDQNILRKFNKQQQRNIDFQQDFAANLSAGLILRRILDSTAAQSQNIERALHLYSRGNKTSSLLHGAVECIDQLPFKQIQASITQTMKMLPAQQYDIVFSNLVFDWLDAGAFIRMQEYLLKPEGMFWFSCYGPSTALISRSIMSEIETFPHFNEFYDLRDVGDALLGAGFKDVVLESSITHLEYDSVNAVMADAVRVFGLNGHPERRKSMTPSGVLKQYKLRVEEEIRSDGKFTDQVEILIAHGKKSSVPAMGGTIPVRHA